MSWGIIEEDEFRAELNCIIPNPKESDAFLEGAILYLSNFADLEPQLDNTEMYYKTVPCPRIGRIVVIWYTIEERVVLRSATSFKIPDDPL